MSWQIRLPMRSEHEPLNANALHDLPNAIEDPTEREVVRGLMLDAMGLGVTTVGELAEQLERAPQSKRRAMLDRAREAVGLPTAARADAERQLALSRMTAPIGGEPRDLVWSAHGWVDLQEQEADRARAERDRRVLEARRRDEEAEREANALNAVPTADDDWPANIPR